MPSSIATKTLLSGGINGRSIKVAATATPGTTLHTSVTGTAQIDEIWLWFMNSDTVSRLITVEFGGTTSPDDLVQITLPSQVGPVLVIPGWLLNNALVVKAFAAATNVVLANGFVNRITP